MSIEEKEFNKEEIIETIKDYLNTAVATAIVNAGVKIKKDLVATIKYAREDTKRLEKIPQGDWIDVYSDRDYILKKGQYVLINLGFSMKLPEGYEAHLAPRSSTYKNFGIIMTNSIGIIDESYCGDNDIWRMPVKCLSPKLIIDDNQINEDNLLPDEKYYSSKEEFLDILHRTRVIDNGVYIPRFSKIAQFRLVEKMPKLELLEVTSLGTKDRGGFGSTGKF